MSYPVIIPYSVGGSTDFGDHQLNDGVVEIVSGIAGEISVVTILDSVVEGTETIEIMLDEPVNAVLSSIVNHTISLIEGNSSPHVSLSIKQGGKAVSEVASDQGNVELVAQVTDANASDQHSYNWSVTDNAIIPLSGYTENKFTFDPADVTKGLYQISLEVQDNGVPQLSNSTALLVKVLEAAPVFSPLVDSDNDGKSDALEGVEDFDGDRIPDYLDPSETSYIIAANDSGDMMQTTPGLYLRLGDSTFASDNVNTQLTFQDLEEHGGQAGGVASSALDGDYSYPSGLYDFDVMGVSPGGAAPIVIPLRVEIPSNSVYRKYNSEFGWQDFVEDSENAVFSAPGSPGACPTPNDESYRIGLNAGEYCVQLVIEDGGPNDDDGVANGIISDPGGIASLDMAVIYLDVGETKSISSQSIIYGARGYETLQVNGSGVFQDRCHYLVNI